MDRFLNLKLPQVSRKNPMVFLASFWTLGLLSGAACSVSASDSIVPLMHAAAECCVSITGLLTAILLPFLLSALAVFIQVPRLIYPIAFCKAFLVSFLGLGVMIAYGSAGWLVRLLLMFGDCCITPLLFWYWNRQLSAQHRRSFGLTTTVFLAALCIGSFDYCIVTPFLAAVIS